jgi:hypothetical protein
MEERRSERKEMKRKRKRKRFLSHLTSCFRLAIFFIALE